MTRPLLHRLALWLAVALPAPGACLAADDFSEAEQALFIDPQLAGVSPPATLHYRYRKSGTLEAGFDDDVNVTLSRQPDGSCCLAHTEFLSPTRRVQLPDIESAQGNPVILSFLERDIHEMQRLTKGQHNYFRKRIRMAVYEGATIRELKRPYRDGQVTVREISIAPYLDDPMRSRFETLAGKRYVFSLSKEVPGGVYALRSWVAAEAQGAEPLLVEELQADGVPPTPREP
ncbi:hypothetical protein AACH06_02905 [Ideonella sp. DXS29W]|uniref:DUF1571 domain-containing protein n=1 Tax=Ideonella lacteola TaxID=2984193 RepID=A0ABU9BKZ8_9BURK